jgi:hypothetical protein
MAKKGTFDEKELEEILGESDHFEIEVYLSSDGKNTVKYRVPEEHSTSEVRKKALETAKKIYDAILEVYGTKQAQAVREYRADSEKKEDFKEMNQDCKHELFAVRQVKKEGKNKGKLFKTCTTCKKFLEWVE